jgi:prepilin-type N-terminal cleavage/methylation domain-containing protein/prepilin-type processing-associated H-X9-DG protein
MITPSSVAACAYYSSRFCGERRRRGVPSGFTLTELLAVIAIVGVLAAILIPVVLRVRESSRSAACQSNLRQLGAAFLLYQADHKQSAPPTYTSSNMSFWSHYLLGTVPGGGTNYLGVVPACPSAESSSGTVGGYGMSNLYLWYPSPAHRVDDVPRFYSARLQRPADWPLFMDADWLVIYGLDDPVETATANTRFAARHGGWANVLMADIHVETARYGDTRWRQQTLNAGPYSYYTP